MKQRVHPRERSLTLGTFVKTDSAQITEILGTTGLDFVVIDAEHAPFDRLTLDRHMMAGRATQMPVWVRVPDMSGPSIQSALDLGAAGIVVPRVDTPEQARAVVAHARFRGGSRGFSVSPRSAGYGTQTMTSALDEGDQTGVMCQIESAQGVDQAAAIAAVPGVDGLLIGRADLALSMGLENIRHPAVSEACSKIIDAATGAGIVAAMFVPDVGDAAAFVQRGVTCFVVSSDQSLLRNAVVQAASKERLRARLSTEAGADNA